MFDPGLPGDPTIDSEMQTEGATKQQIIETLTGTPRSVDPEALPQAF
jgi:hypothetical protein